MKQNSNTLLLAQTLYTKKGSPLKYKFMTFSSALVKICQIPAVNSELTSQFLFKFCIILHCYETKLLCKFWAHTFFTLDKRIPSKSQFLDFQTWALAKIYYIPHVIFESTSQFFFKFCIDIQCHQTKFKIDILMSILNWHVNSSSNFSSYFNVLQNCPVNFNLLHFLLRIKGSHQSPNF